MKIKRSHLTPVFVLLATFGIAGCGNIVAKLMPPSDYAKLDNFHDVNLEKDSTTVVFKSQQGMSLSSAEVWSEEFALSPAGLGKVHVKDVQNTDLPDKNGYSGYAPAYYEVSVTSSTAPNLKWEVWMANDQYQMHSAFGSSDIHFKKIMGPFKAGQLARLDYLKYKVDSYGQIYQPRNPVIVVYSPSERGEKFTVNLYKPQLAK